MSPVVKIYNILFDLSVTEIQESFRECDYKILSKSIKIKSDKRPNGGVQAK